MRNQVDLVPVVVLEITTELQPIAKLSDQARVPTLLGTNHLPTIRDDPASAAFGNLTDIRAIEIEVELIPGKIPLCFARIERRSTGAPCAQRRNEAAILNAAIGIGSFKFNFQLQFKIGWLPTLPNEKCLTKRAGSRAGRRCRPLADNRAIDHFPHVRISVPSVERGAVEHFGVAGALIKVDRIRLAKISTPTASRRRC